MNVLLLRDSDGTACQGRAGKALFFDLQVIFNAFHAFNRFGDTFSTFRLCLIFYRTGKLDHTVGGFNFDFTGRHNIIR